MTEGTAPVGETGGGREVTSGGTEGTGEDGHIKGQGCRRLHRRQGRLGWRTPVAAGSAQRTRFWRREGAGCGQGKRGGNHASVDMLFT